MKTGGWYVVTWHDAYSSVDVDWKKVKKLDTGPLVIISAGQVVKKTQKYVTLAQTVDTNSGRVSCLINIPEGMIVAAKRVKINSSRWCK